MRAFAVGATPQFLFPLAVLGAVTEISRFSIGKDPLQSPPGLGGDVHRAQSRQCEA